MKNAGVAILASAVNIDVKWPQLPTSFFVHVRVLRLCCGLHPFLKNCLICVFGCFPGFGGYPTVSVRIDGADEEQLETLKVFEILPLFCVPSELLRRWMVGARIWEP